MAWLIKKATQSSIAPKAIVLVAFMLLFFGAYAFYSIWQKQGSQMVTTATVLDGTFHTFYMERSDLYLQLDADETKWKVKNVHNTAYENVGLNRFLEKGDRLSKKAGSDTLYIHREGTTYFFILLMD